MIFNIKQMRLRGTVVSPKDGFTIDTICTLKRDDWIKNRGQPSLALTLHWTELKAMLVSPITTSHLVFF
jgi:hypothetical protein